MLQRISIIVFSRILCHHEAETLFVCLNYLYGKISLVLFLHLVLHRMTRTHVCVTCGKLLFVIFSLLLPLVNKSFSLISSRSLCYCLKLKNSPFWDYNEVLSSLPPWFDECIFVFKIASSLGTHRVTDHYRRTWLCSPPAAEQSYIGHSLGFLRICDCPGFLGATVSNSGVPLLLYFLRAWSLMEPLSFSAVSSCPSFICTHSQGKALIKFPSSVTYIGIPLNS